MEKSLQLPSGYHELLQELKGRIRTAQVRAGLAVSRELVLLYWSIGRDLSQRFATEEWGSKINERLARDLQAEFPGVEGFSPRNLRYMRALAEAWPEPEILQSLIAKLPWGHNLRVLDRSQGSSHPRVVPAGSARIRLESGCTGSSDQEPLCTRGKGRH